MTEATTAARQQLLTDLEGRDRGFRGATARHRRCRGEKTAAVRARVEESLRAARTKLRVDR